MAFPTAGSAIPIRVESPAGQIRSTIETASGSWRSHGGSLWDCSQAIRGDEIPGGSSRCTRCFTEHHQPPDTTNSAFRSPMRRFNRRRIAGLLIRFRWSSASFSSATSFRAVRDLAGDVARVGTTPGLRERCEESLIVEAARSAQNGLPCNHCAGRIVCGAVGRQCRTQSPEIEGIPGSEADPGHTSSPEARRSTGRSHTVLAVRRADRILKSPARTVCRRGRSRRHCPENGGNWLDPPRPAAFLRSGMQRWTSGSRHGNCEVACPEAVARRLRTVPFDWGALRSHSSRSRTSRWTNVVRRDDLRAMSDKGG